MSVHVSTNRRYAWLLMYTMLSKIQRLRTGPRARLLAIIWNVVKGEGVVRSRPGGINLR